MRKVKRSLLWLFSGLMVAFILGILAVLIYSLCSHNLSNEYSMRLQLSLNAANLTSGLHVKVGDGYQELDADSYRQLSFYLRCRPTLALLGGDQKSDQAVELLIGEDKVRVVPLGTKGDKAIVYFETSGIKYRMQVRNAAIMDCLKRVTGPDYYYLGDGGVQGEEMPVSP